MDRPFYPEFVIAVFPRLLAFLPVTLLILGGTVVFGSLLGFVLAKTRIGRSGIFRKISGGYTLIMRCTPSIVLLFILYYALPELVQAVFGLDINGISRSFFVILTLSLLFAANMGELMRSAYEAVDKGQREAALSAGLSETQAFFRITAPQAVVVALPNFGNALIALMKEGALAYTIGMIDMMGQGTLIISRNYGAYGLETYIALALIYWTLTIVIERSFRGIEKYLSKGKQSLGT
jgi:L-cystine transport system permease protein